MESTYTMSTTRSGARPLQYLTAGLLLLGLVAGCAAQTVTLRWNAPTNAAEARVTGYRVWLAPAGTTNWSVLGAAASTNYVMPFSATSFGDRYFVTATNAVGLESPPSNVATNLIPRSPENMRLNHNLSFPP